MKVEYDRIPETVRERLAAATASPEAPADHSVFPLESAGWKTFGVVFGALNLLAVIALAIVETSRWREEETMAVGGGALFGALFFVFNFLRLRAFVSSPVKPAIVATPIMIARTGLAHEPVQMHYLKDLANTNIVHHHTNGVYQYTAFAFTFNDGSLAFNLSPKPKAEGFLAFLRSGPDVVRGWITAGSANEKIPAFDWIGEIQGAKTPPEPAAGPSLLKRSWFARLLAAVLVAGAVTGVARGAHEVAYERHAWDMAKSFDSSSEYKWYLSTTSLGWHKDEAEVALETAAFKEAVRDGKASAFRKFRTEFPKGPHAEEARQKLYALYASAEEKYLGLAKAGYPKAVEGMKALLARLKESNDPTVWIYFMPAEGLEGAPIEKRIRELTGAAKIEPVGPAFTAERNKMREGRIISGMEASFSKIFADDLFDLKQARKTEAGPRFLVRYTVVGQKGDNWYSNSLEKELPIKDRHIFVAIALEFDFTLQVTEKDEIAEDDPSKGYRFSMTADPADEFDAPRYGTVYDAMADTAFAQFEQKLAAAYGLDQVGGGRPAVTGSAQDEKGDEDD